MARLAQLLVAVFALHTCSAFVALPRAPTQLLSRRAPAAVVPALPITACAAAAEPPQDSGAKTGLLASLAAIGAKLGKFNFLGLEYITFVLLLFWGSFCVALNYFLWIFRYLLEVSGLAPETWYFKDQKRPKNPFKSE